MPGMSTPDPLHATPPPPPGLAIACLVLGILAVTLSPFLIGGILGIIAVGLGALFLRKRVWGRRMCAWGMGLGALGIVLAGAAAAFYYYSYQQAQKQFAQYEQGMDENDDGEPASEWVGTRAPALSLTTLDGERVELSQLKGRPVVLNFWATWCAACKREQPHLERLAREVPEVTVLRLSDEPESTLRAEGAKVSYRVASVTAPPAPLDGVTSLPTTVYIDRNGVIADVQVGVQDFDALKSRALTASYPGTPREAVATAQQAESALAAKERWSTTIEGVIALSSCQWQGDDAPELLLATASRQLLVLDALGVEKARLALPAETTVIECANQGDGAARLLAHRNWGNEVSALDGSGQALWSYRAPGGVNGAHWGDLDGDGQLELVVGMNGDGGLHAVSSKGRRLWLAGKIGNVWGQAVVPGSMPEGVLVVATEAGGSVRVFDDDGSKTATLQPLGDYYTAIAATGIDGDGTPQVVAVGRERVVAFGLDGQVVWQAKVRPSAGSWRSAFFANGDLAGDSAPEWVFPVRRRALRVASASDGRALVEVALRDPPSAYGVLPATSGKGLLVIADATTVKAYTLEPGPLAAH